MSGRHRLMLTAYCKKKIGLLIMKIWTMMDKHEGRLHVYPALAASSNHSRSQLPGLAVVEISTKWRQQQQQQQQLGFRLLRSTQAEVRVVILTVYSSRTSLRNIAEK
jgi:hypothetical protein